VNREVNGKAVVPVTTRTYVITESYEGTTTVVDGLLTTLPNASRTRIR
jgi:hypothetical protein